MRERVPLAWGIYQKPPEEMAADAAAGVRVGRALTEPRA